MLLNYNLSDPSLLASGDTATTQPITKPKAPTGTTGTNDPTAPVAALPLAGAPAPTPAPAPAPAPTAPMPAPTSPPPLTTSDPLAFATSAPAPAAPAPTPVTPAPTVAPASTSPSSGLPAGYTMGTGDLYGAGYYNGQKILGTSADGFYWLDDGKGGMVKGPQASASTDQAIQNAANAGFSGWEASQQQAAGKANPAYGAFLDAMQAAGVQPGQSVDTAPASVQQAYQNFLAHPIAEPSTAPTGPAEYLTGGMTHYADGTPVPGGYNALADLYQQRGDAGAVNPAVLDLIRQNPNIMQGLPAAQQTTLMQTLQNLGIQLPMPSGSANDAGAPSGGIAATIQRLLSPGAANDAGTPSSLPPGSPGSVTLGPGGTGNGIGGASAPPAGGTPGGSSQIAPGVAGYQTTPDNALTNLTLLPSNNVDRVQLAQDALHNTIQNVLDPAYHARERDLNRYNFGAGRGVSGAARTSQGDVESDYGRQIANLSNTLLNSATTGSIDDMYRNLGLALQEQGFQAGQQNTAFNQNLALQGLGDTEQQQAFSRFLQMLTAGSSGNPADTALILSQIYGSQAGNAGNAASNYVASQQQQQNQQQQQQAFQDWLNQLIANNIAGQPIPGVQTTPGMGY